MTLHSQARLRDGPSAASELIALLPAGTTVEIVGVSGEWSRVRTAGGRIGYVVSENLSEGDEAATSDGTRRVEVGTRGVAEDVRDLRDQLTALGRRPEPATAADLKRLRVEMKRLASAERALARRLDDHVMPGASPADPLPESGPGLGPAFLLVGLVAGWTASRLFQRRRDRFQRSRLRL